MVDDQNKKFMSQALRLAKRAEGNTSPNPLVGAVVVKNGEIIGKGYHKKAGMPHGEIEAFNDAKKKHHDLRGSTLYVTLEPCSHRDKRTPPCTDAIIKNKISKVVVSTLDPNPKVSGNGINKLKKAGIKVEVGVLEEKSKELNEIFFKHITTGTPFVILKLAVTLDGKIATYTGDSKWIGSETQRKYAHQLRQKVDSVMVGIGTVIQDNPSLNVRIKRGSITQPTPVVLDSKLRIPAGSNIFSIHERPIIVTTDSAKKTNQKKLEDKGALVIRVENDKRGLIDLKELSDALYKNGITSVLIEGGSKVAASAIKSGIVDKIIFFYAPKIVGSTGLSMIDNLGISTIKDSFQIKELKLKKYNDEFMIEGYLK